jgi:hypothetical protein
VCPCTGYERTRAAAQLVWQRVGEQRGRPLEERASAGGQVIRAMRFRYLAIGLFGLAAGFLVAFAATFLDGRMPWWGHVVFGVPGAEFAAAAVWAARQHVRS